MIGKQKEKKEKEKESDFTILYLCDILSKEKGKRGVKWRDNLFFETWITKKEPMLCALAIVMQSNDRLYFQRPFLKNGDFYIK